MDRIVEGKSDPKLIQSYVRGRWFVSTALRSAEPDPFVEFYETWAWPLDEDGKRQAEGAFLCAGKVGARAAMRQHASVCRDLAKKCPPCELATYEDGYRA